MKGISNFINDAIEQKKFEYLKTTMETENLGFSLKNNIILKTLLCTIDEYDQNYFFLMHYYPSVLSSYDKIIKNFSDLSKKLDLSDSLDVCILFSYLLWNGYFSVDKKLCDSSKDNLEIFDFFSLEIMSGQGVCLHFSYLFKDFLQACGYDSAILLSWLKKVDYHKIYFPDITRQMNQEHDKEIIIARFLKELFKYIGGNHAFNLINDHENLYIYDSTNLLYIPLSDCVGSKIQGEFIKGVVHPNFSYAFNLEYSSIKTLDLYHQKKKESCYSLDEYEVKSKKLLEKFGDFQNLFEDSYHESVDDILMVSDGVKKLKKSIF